MESGTRLGHYEVIAPLGAGGMGEVYRARDSNLKREVAIKVLPEAVAADQNRLDRLEREAHLLASLNHINIASIHSLERDADTRFLVLELVEGETLAEKLQQGCLPVEEALEAAKQIAEALEAAHEKGIIHRDLKPANVMLTPAGIIKVLDFGLAKGFEAKGEKGDVTRSSTITVAGTRAGVIMGTAAYMSPEQARGHSVDTRSDIWSFGCVVFEMLTGRCPFAADNASESIGAVLHTEPEWSRLPAAAPASVRHLLQRCLAKDRHLRLQHIGDARIELQHPLEQESPTSDLPAARSSLTSSIGWVVAGGSLLLAALGWLGRPDPQVRPERRLIVNTPAASNLSASAVSPDGRRIAFTGGSGLWVRDLDRLESRRLTDAPEAATPFWSPDGEWIAYTVRGQILKLPVGGGQPTTVGAVTDEVTPGIGGGFWTDDDRLLISAGGGVVVALPAGGGEAEVVIDATETEHFHDLTGLPGTSALLVTVDPDAGPERIDLWADGARRPLIDGPARTPRWWVQGFVLFSRADAIWALPFDPQELAATGEPFVLIPRGRGVSTANDGSFLYFHPGDREHQLVWVDHDGALSETLATSSSALGLPAISSANGRAAYVVQDSVGPRVWWWDPARGVPAVVEETTGYGNGPAWSPDGTRLYYATPNAETEDAEDFQIHAQDLRSGAITTVQSDGFGPSVSTDGRYLVFVRNGGLLFMSELWYMPLVPEPGEAILFAGPSGTFSNYRVSPDGRHIAYFHSPTGATGVEVYVDRFPQSTGRFRVSDGGLTGWLNSLAWSPDGRRLFYTRATTGSMMEIEITETDTGAMQTSEPREIFTGLASDLVLLAGFALSPDGDRFLMVRSTVPAGGDAGGFVLVDASDPR